MEAEGRIMVISGVGKGHETNLWEMKMLYVLTWWQVLRCRHES